MVNMIMRASGDETITMSRSFLMRKYSHCPLKKRPLQYVKEADFDNNDSSDDNSEPENLSTKPEDLRLPCKSRAPPSSIVAFTPVKKDNEKSLNEAPALITSDTFTVDRASVVAGAGIRSVGRLFNRTNGGPLEPLSLNTPSIDYRLPPANASWPRSVPAHYPQHFVSLNYVHQPPPPLQHPSPVIQSDRLSSPYSYHSEWTRDRSPTRHAFAPFRSYIPTASHPQQTSAESCLSRVQIGQPSSPPFFSSSSTLSTNSPIYSAYHPTPATVTVAEKSSNGDNKWTGDLSNQTTIVDDNANKNTSKGKDTTAPRYRCALCAKMYSTFSGLSKHRQFHCDANEETASKKKFACKYCQKEYNTLGALKMHIRTHTLPCKCVHCGKAFSRPWLLQGHIRTHTGEKPFTCTLCSRAFADRSNLRAHLQTHSDVKKYSCTTCRKTFSRMSLLSKHIEGGCPGLNTTVIRVTEDVN